MFGSRRCSFCGSSLYFSHYEGEFMVFVCPFCKEEYREKR